MTHWLTWFRVSGSLQSHIIQGFPPCTPRVTPLHFLFPRALPTEAPRFTQRHAEKLKWRSHLLAQADTFLTVCLQLEESPGSCLQPLPVLLFFLPHGSCICPLQHSMHHCRDLSCSSVMLDTGFHAKSITMQLENTTLPY